jgi:hypothetical protein
MLSIAPTRKDFIIVNASFPTDNLISWKQIANRLPHADDETERHAGIRW